MKKQILYIVTGTLLILSCSKKEAAIVNGSIIYEKDVLEKIKSINTDTVKRYGEENIKQNILDGLIERQLILCVIKEENYEKDKKIQSVWPQYKKNISLKYFLNDYLPDKHPLSKSILTEEYNSKKELFKKDGEVQARHILIKTGKDGHADAEAQKKILSIQNEIKKDGSNFADLAKKYSECPSASDGGNLGYFTRGRMAKAFEEASFSLKKGEITNKPVKTEFGYHLIFVEDVKESTYAPLEEVKSLIMPGLYLTNMTKEYELSTYPENIRNKNNFLGEIKKLNYKYNHKEFYDELGAAIGKENILKYIQDKENTERAIKEFLLVRVLEDKMKIFGIEKDEKYQEFIKKTQDEFLSSNYLESVVFKNVSVNDYEVLQIYKNNVSRDMLIQQYGAKFGSDAAFRKKIENEMVFPAIKKQLFDQKKNDLYSNLITELKQKYNIKLLIQYKTN